MSTCGGLCEKPCSATVHAHFGRLSRGGVIFYIAPGALAPESRSCSSGEEVYTAICMPQRVCVVFNSSATGSHLRRPTHTPLPVRQKCSATRVLSPFCPLSTTRSWQGREALQPNPQVRRMPPSQEEQLSARSTPGTQAPAALELFVPHTPCWTTQRTCPYRDERRSRE